MRSLQRTGPGFDKLSPNGLGKAPGFDKLTANGWNEVNRYKNNSCSR